MSHEVSERAATSSAPEDLFAELFTQVFGLEKALLLVPQYPVRDIDEGSRFVDYALRTRDQRVAFEIDGLTWHVPDATSVAKYEDDLLKQNSLVHSGWRVFRWTDRQLVQEPERVKEQVGLFLERVPGLLPFDDFLPRQTGEVVELRAHQEDALQALEGMRNAGKTIALLDHATGAGKTVTAITDARRLGKRTLWLVHTRTLVAQTQKEFRVLWPEVETGRYHGGAHETDADNLVGSIQSVAENLDEFAPTKFGYLVIDEAHHAAAETYRRVLEYFKPGFILGLTATAQRADGQDLLELFRNFAHRLSLQEAVERGELVPIRCLRVQTNVDLSRVRYNQVQYNRRDIEEAIAIPARDRLIVDTYLQHVRGRKAVAFAVNVRHGEALAEEFRARGVAAASVSGRMTNREREQHLRDFAEGNLRVLCACDILNEGWDCPDVEVLLMARPTLSRVIYLQQLGRGTRKAPGKECLVVFDFVDNASRYNQSLSLHRVLGVSRDRRGGLAIGAPRVEDHTARDRFVQFIEGMDMTMSYKPVMLLALLDVVGEDGRAKLSDVVQRFRRFYQDRRAAGLAVERPGARRQDVDELDEVAAGRLMLGKPFEPFERRRFLRYDRDLAYVRVEPRLWRQLGVEDLQRVRAVCERSIESYYGRFAGG